MTILAYGMNYRTASIELRERVAFPEEAVQDALQRVVDDVGGVREAAILSTCNRTELYCALKPGAEPDLNAWLADQREVGASELEEATYHHWDQDAAKHQIRVAAAYSGRE